MKKNIEDEKQMAVNKFLKEDYVLVHVVTGSEGVNLPDYLKESPSVTLKLSRLFRGGMEVDESGITADLLFANEYHTCKIPYKAIWGMTSARGDNLIWAEQAPKEFLEGWLKKDGPATAKKSVTHKKTSKHLRRVK